MFLEFRNPMPVIIVEKPNTPPKEGFAIYVRDGGAYENDYWCVVLKDGGIVRHYTSAQINIEHNATLGIKKIDGSI